MGRLAPPAIRKKWRPSLAMLVCAVLAVVMALPLVGMAAVVLLTRPPDLLLASLRDNIGLIAAASLMVAATTSLVGYLFWRLVSRPVRELLVWTEHVASRGSVAQSDETRYGTRELARLAASFGDMVRRLNERSHYIETYTAHVSHELKSPLTSIAGAAEIMREAGGEMDAATRARFMDNIEQDALRLSALVTRMRELARVEADRPSGSSSLSDVLDRLRERTPSLQIIQRRAYATLPLPIDDAVLVLSHLADNAVDHGARTMTVELAHLADFICLRVSNDGAPISGGDRDRIFEPFFTTRREAGGTGMGLPIIRRLLMGVGATIDLADPEGISPGSKQGASFLIRFWKLA